MTAAQRQPASEKYHRSLIKSLILSSLFMSLAATTSTAAAKVQSLRNWVTCNGTSDESTEVAAAFAAARHNAFTLVVDCPVFLHSGLDPSRAIFIDNGTTVEFTGAGKFRVDNVLHPAFVLANTIDVTLLNWNVEYDASLGVNWDTGGIESKGVFVKEAGYAQPAFAFENDLANWLSAHRSITFDRSVNQAVSSIWAGPTNSCAVFFLTGDTSNIRVLGLKLYAPATAGGNRFVPMAFAMTENYKNSQTITTTTPRTSKFVATPHNLTFANIYLDGTYMGWQGNAQDVLFENIRSHRYGDLQDANGAHVGGLNKWFAPPHLFYLDYDTAGDAALFNTNIHFENVTDDGIRVGVARDKGGSDSTSGYAASLKLGCIDCSVNAYSSARPDGLVDILTSDNLTVSNVAATYDSAFTHSLYPGWRFPSKSYGRLNFENVALRDTAVSTTLMPLGSAGTAPNQVLEFSNIDIAMNGWAAAGMPIPYMRGLVNKISILYSMEEKLESIASATSGTLKVNIGGVPNKLKSGGAVVLTWAAPQANSCVATGAWSGALLSWGERTIKLTKPGNYDYTIGCSGPKNTVKTTLRVVVTS